MRRTRTPRKAALGWIVAGALLAATLGFANSGAARAQGEHEVVILVVDDFTGPDLSDLADAAYEEDAACTISLEGQAFAIRGVAADPITVPHGELVMEQLEEMVASADAGGFITLVPVDIHGATTEEAAGRIAEALDQHPADAYVVNMSFAIMPCEYLEAFAAFDGELLDARGARNLNRYRSIFQRAVLFYDDTVFPVMSQKAQSETELDPIQALLAARSEDVIPVAAAGNFGLDYPFWPGAWGQVISVSASQGMGYHAGEPWNRKSDAPLLKTESDRPGQQKRISNYGEVMMPGEFESSAGPVSGTSFAAPRMSFLLAMAVSADGPGICRDADGALTFASGEWDNLALIEAVEAHCPALAPRLPPP